MKMMTLQMPEETYQRMKAYFKRRGKKQNEFIEPVLQKTSGGTADSDARKIWPPISY